MGTIWGIIAFLVALAGVLAVVGNGAYLALLGNVAKKRPGGEVTTAYVKKQLPIAGGAGAAAIVALMLQTGGGFADTLAIVVGAGAGAVSMLQLSGTRRKYGQNAL